jgi:hypothetical protein
MGDNDKRQTHPFLHTDNSDRLLCCVRQPESETSPESRIEFGSINRAGCVRGGCPLSKKIAADEGMSHKRGSAGGAYILNYGMYATLWLVKGLVLGCLMPFTSQYRTHREGRDVCATRVRAVPESRFLASLGMTSAVVPHLGPAGASLRVAGYNSFFRPNCLRIPETYGLQAFFRLQPAR